MAPRGLKPSRYTKIEAALIDTAPQSASGEAVEVMASTPFVQ
jgi:hypothetical protein